MTAGHDSEDSSIPSISTVSSAPEPAFPPSLIIMLCIGGVITTASIIIIISVVVFIRKSQRELKTRAAQPLNSGPPRSSSARRSRVVQGHPGDGAQQNEGRGGADCQQPDAAHTTAVPVEMQGFYAVIPHSEVQYANTEEMAEGEVKKNEGGGIVYAALDFDDDSSTKPGCKEGDSETTDRPTSGQCHLATPSPQDTCIEMIPFEPSHVSNPKDPPPLHAPPAESVYSLATDPDSMSKPDMNNVQLDGSQYDCKADGVESAEQ